MPSSTTVRQGASKVWSFTTDVNSPYLGLATGLNELSSANSTLRQQAFVWTQDAAGTAYIGSVTTKLPNGNGGYTQTKTEQTLDVHGNGTLTRIYDYGATTPALTYTSTFLSDTNYTSRHIWNRLVSTQVSDGTQSSTLVNNTYDGFGSLVNLTPLTHHDSAYSVAFRYRGNISAQTTPGKTTNLMQYITGDVFRVYDDQGHTVENDTVCAQQLRRALGRDARQRFRAGNELHVQRFPRVDVHHPAEPGLQQHYL